MSTVPSTPRRAAARRQEAKTAATAAIQGARVGYVIVYKWRVIAHDDTSDEGWIEWKGKIEEVAATDEGVVRHLVVRYEPTCEELRYWTVSN